MKLYEQEISVETQHGLPRHIRWDKVLTRGCRKPLVQTLEARVQHIEEVWLWHGRWWLTPGLKGYERRYFRVQAATASGTPILMEIYHSQGRWILSRLDD